jgi:hypothetical protein
MLGGVRGVFDAWALLDQTARSSPAVANTLTLGLAFIAVCKALGCACIICCGSVLFVAAVYC